MPGPKAIEVNLSEAETAVLKELVQARHTEQGIAQRARIVLQAGEGQSNSEIGRELGVRVKTVKKWRERWVKLQDLSLTDLKAEERLADLPRSGNPGRISADQRCQIEQLVCELPEQSERPISQWTNRELADEIMKRGIVSQISARHAGRLLKRSRSQTASEPLLADRRSR